MEDDEIQNSDFWMTINSFQKLTTIVLIVIVDRESAMYISIILAYFPYLLRT